MRHKKPGVELFLMNRLFPPVSIFFFLFFPLTLHAQVDISEVAWMGTTASANDEWIELQNVSGESVDLTGWTLMSSDGTPTIGLSGAISAGEFFLLERTNDDTVAGIAADIIYTGALSNTSENLVLKNGSGVEVTNVSADPDWPAGNNDTKETMQWNGSAWITGTATPKAQNVSSGSTPGNEDTSNDEGGGGASGTTSFSVHTIPVPVTNVEEISNIYISAGPDRLTTTGSRVFFEGFAFDDNDTRKVGGIFSWTFGDGGIASGEEVTHTYTYPGTYVVALNVSYGADEAVSRAKVKVIDPLLGVSFGNDKKGTPYVQVTNNSEYEINLSQWVLKSDAPSTFIFPKDTIIEAGGTVIFPSTITKIAPQKAVYIFDPSDDERARGGFETGETKDKESKELLESNTGKSSVNALSAEIANIQGEALGLLNSLSKKILSTDESVTQKPLSQETNDLEEKGEAGSESESGENGASTSSVTSQAAFSAGTIEVIPPDSVIKKIVMFPIRGFQFLLHLIF